MGEVESGQVILQQVRDHPTNLKFTLPSQLAEVYLLTYEQTKNTQVACQAAVEVAQKAFPDESTISSENLNEWVKEWWGFAEHVNDLSFVGYNWDYICNSEITVQNK